MQSKNTIQQIVNRLTDNHQIAYPNIPLRQSRVPSPARIREMTEVIRSIVFPGYFGDSSVNEGSLVDNTKLYIDKLTNLLSSQIYDALFFETQEPAPAEAEEESRRLTARFLESLPRIKYLLSTDIKAIFNTDPAATCLGEVIFCYPAVKAISNYRIAHELSLLKIPVLPRIISESAHSETGIDIHPEAEIGEYFSIDHGTGIVIGQTTIIGKHVTLYQGVTLGAKNFELDAEGRPLNIPRHPVLKDNVTVYSNSSILGRITIGERTTIGGNVWLTHDVPPDSLIVQSKCTGNFRKIK
ncbi:MAG: serine acetyltransferase [Dysgonamonadaceae bacterium]|jgi:serine O-acetyltransferase|nr:serine acetyltransferase [Dysgonamonadaceae bacterium]